MIEMPSANLTDQLSIRWLADRQYAYEKRGYKYKDPLHHVANTSEYARLPKVLWLAWPVAHRSGG